MATFADAQASLAAERASLGDNLPTEHEARIAAQIETYVNVMGGGQQILILKRLNQFYRRLERFRLLRWV